MKYDAGNVLRHANKSVAFPHWALMVEFCKNSKLACAMAAVMYLVSKNPALLSTMACLKYAQEEGVATCVLTDDPPALSPNKVIRLGSPPNASMFDLTQAMDSRWSKMA